MTRKTSAAFCTSAALLVAFCTPLSAATLPYSETFTGADGSPWPAPWFAGGAHVTAWDLSSNRGRLNGDWPYVARMILPGYAETDVEVNAVLEFENVAHQGIGFYVRQNGGTLQEYLPHGQGYAIFLKGNWAWPEDLGLWREIDGVEMQFATGYDPVPGGLMNGVRYRVRYRVTQVAPDTTYLRARVWPEASPEPAFWNVEAYDTVPPLQGTAGSFAIDIYNHNGTSNVYLDDISIDPFPAQSAVPAFPAGAVSLSPPYPHPARGPVRFDVNIPEGAAAALDVFDVGGRRVARPYADLGAGSRTLVWNPVDSSGWPLPAGAYFLRLDVPGAPVVRKMVVTD